MDKNNQPQDPKTLARIKKQQTIEKSIKRQKVIEEYTEKFRNNELLITYYSNNVISPDFFKLDDYKNYDRIRQIIPSCCNMNNPNFDPSYLSYARFFVIRSYCEDDVHKAVKYGYWCSTHKINNKLDSVYREVRADNIPVFLLFT